MEWVPARSWLRRRANPNRSIAIHSSATKTTHRCALKWRMLEPLTGFTLFRVKCDPLLFPGYFQAATLSIRRTARRLLPAKQQTGQSAARSASWSQCMRKKRKRALHEPSIQIRMTNDEIRRKTEIRMTNPAIALESGFRHLGFGFLSSFDLCHSSFDSMFMVPMHAEKRKGLSMKMSPVKTWHPGAFPEQQKAIGVCETTKPEKLRCRAPRSVLHSF